MPKISIIIPTYNRSKLLTETVDSVLNQSLSDLEVLIVDDGSTDETRSVVKQIRDKRVRYFYKENKGIGSARNLGLLHCCGEYVSFLDDDDLWPENYLATMVSNLERKPEYGAAYSLFKNFYPDGKIKDAFGSDRFLSGWLTKHYYKKIPCILPSASLFRKNVWNNFWWDESLSKFEDVEAFLRLSAKIQFLYVPNTFIKRRLSQDRINGKAKLSPMPILVFERFYFHFGGDKIVPERIAKRKISRVYRRLAKKHYQLGHRKAAISLFKKAIKYYPFDPQYYRGLSKAMFLNKENDKLPDWQMPKPLSAFITAFGRKAELI